MMKFSGFSWKYDDTHYWSCLLYTSVLEAMGQEYGVTFTPEETKKFMLASTFGVPMKSMKKYLEMCIRDSFYTGIT